MNRRLSIDIGSRNMHIVEGGFEKGKLTLRQSQSFEIPAGCITDESINDEQLLADAINNSIKAGRFHAKEAVLTVNASHAVIREMDFPKAKPNELESMIKNEMHQTFHIVKGDVIQYKEIGKAAGSDREALIRYRVAAIEHGMVEAYYNVLNRTMLKPVAMDLNVNAMDKLFSWSDGLNDRFYGEDAVMLLDFGQSLTTVYIVQKHKPIFYRHLNIGSGGMDAVLINVAQRYKSGMPEDELDDMLVDVREDVEMDVRDIKGKLDFFNGSEKSKPYYNALQPYLYRLNDEIRKVAAFFNDRSRNSNIAYAYIFGQGSELPGLADYWSEYLSLPVEKLQSLLKGRVKIQINPAHLNAVAALIRTEK